MSDECEIILLLFKSLKMNYKFLLLTSFFTLCFFTACTIEEVPNPNGPDLDAILENATIPELNATAVGIESLMRKDLGFYYDAVSIIGREYYYFTGSDPRYTADLLGGGESTLDNNTFYTTRSFTGRYSAIKNANILLEAVENTSAPVTEEQKNGYRGFAKTIQAYQLLLNLNMQYQNGVRVDVADPDNLGPFLSYDESLSSINDLLEDAYTILMSEDAAFLFDLSSGFSGFETPVSFAKFNRGLAARVQLYQGAYSTAIETLADSFIDLGASLSEGPKNFFSTAGGDVVNPVFRATNQADALVAHPSFLTDIREDDTRLNKVAARNTSIALDDLSGTHDVLVFESQDADITIINNEELLLIQAEANIFQGNMGDAIAALDVILAANGLDAYSGDMDEASLVEELMYNRRYSLYALGHRWVDMRRWDALDALPLDRDGDDIWVEFPRPATEAE